MHCRKDAVRLFFIGKYMMDYKKQTLQMPADT